MADSFDSERSRRIGLNEAVFRNVNERVEAIAETLTVAPARLLLVCECGDIDCTERIEISRVQYEAIRSDPTLFVVCPGHARESVELVVGRGAGFEVIRKKPGAPTTLAERTDPRSD